MPVFGRCYRPTSGLQPEGFSLPSDAPSDPAIDRRQAAIDKMAADLEQRIAGLPTSWDRIPLVDLLLHLHCTDCGLPITRASAAGTAFDLGTARAHVCPVDFGEVFQCRCGDTLLVFTSGRCVNFLGRDVHYCTYSQDLGVYSHAPPVERRVLAAPSKATAKLPGVLELG